MTEANKIQIVVLSPVTRRMVYGHLTNNPDDIFIEAGEIGTLHVGGSRRISVVFPDLTPQIVMFSTSDRGAVWEYIDD